MKILRTSTNDAQTAMKTWLFDSLNHISFQARHAMDVRVMIFIRRNMHL